MPNILKQVGYYSIGNILPVVVGFVLLPLYSRYISPAEYGIINTTTTLSSIVGVFFFLSLDRSIFRLYHDYKDELERKNFLGSISIFITILSTIIFLILILLAHFVEMLFNHIAFFPYIFLAILSTYFNSFSRIPKVYLQTVEKPSRFLILSVMQFLSITVFNVWFIVFQKEQAVGMLKGTAIGNLVVLPFFVYENVKFINLKLNYKYLKGALIFSLPSIPSMISAWVMNLSDRIFIERFNSLTDVGLYSMGYKIAGIILIFSQAFNMAYNPIFYKLANSKDQVSAKNTLFKYNNVYIIACLVIVLCIILFAKEGVQLLIDVKYYDSYKYVTIISLAYYIGLMAGLSNLSLYQVKKTRQIMYFIVIGAITNILFNFMLIPWYGAMGAAISTLIANSVNFLLIYKYSKKCYFIRFRWDLIIQVFVVSIIFYYLVQNYVVFSFYITFIAKIGFILVLLGYLYKKLGLSLNVLRERN